MKHIKIPAPELTVSKEILPFIQKPADETWISHIDKYEDWKNLQENYFKAKQKIIPKLAKDLKVTFTKELRNGVNTFCLLPDYIKKEDENKVILFFHGGSYVVGQDISRLTEAIAICANTKLKLISVDYKMPPEYPYPQAINDAFCVYKDLLKTIKPSQIALAGTSTGGAIALIVPQLIKEQNLPMPAAISAATPWSDFNKIGDSYYTNENINNFLVRYDSLLKDSALLYAKGQDFFNPKISPVYADIKRFPPTIFFSGTRDLFLSNTVRMQKKYLEEEIENQLIVFEGLSHAQYYQNPKSPECELYCKEIRKFILKYMDK